MLVLLAPSQNRGAKFRSTVSCASPWAEQRGVHIQRGTQGAPRADGHVCVCHLRVRMSRRHAPLPSPSACILFSPRRKSGQAGRKSTGGSRQPRRDSGSRGSVCCSTPAPQGRCGPGGCVLPVALPPRSCSPQPGNTHPSTASSPGKQCLGSLSIPVRTVGRDTGRKSPKEQALPQPGELSSTQYLALLNTVWPQSDKC